MTVVPAYQPDTTYFQAIMGVAHPRDPTIHRYLNLFTTHRPRYSTENTGTLLLRQASEYTRASVYLLMEERGPMIFQGKRTRWSPTSREWCDNVVYDPAYQDLWFYSRFPKSRKCM